jgi:hypothetical protein
MPQVEIDAGHAFDFKDDVALPILGGVELGVAAVDGGVEGAGPAFARE